MRDFQTVQVILDLSQHCVETAARHCFRDRMNQLLSQEAEEEVTDGGDLVVGKDAVDIRDVAAQVELLKEFLESHDFKKLRAQDVDLAGGRPCRVRVYWKEEEVTGFEKVAF